MKICVLTHSYPRFEGDTATPFMGNLVSSMAKGKDEIFLLTPYDPLLKTGTRNGVNVTCYKYIFPNKLHILGYARTFKAGKGLSLLTYIISPFMYFFGMIALIKLVKKEKIDIVNAHWIIPNGYIAAIIKFLTGIPLVISIPGADVRMGGSNELFKRMVGFGSKQANHIVSDSTHYIDQLADLGYTPKNVSIIRYGVDTNVFKPQNKDKKLLSELGLSINDKIIVAVGRFVVQKGFIYLVDAFSDINSKIPNAKLVLVGDGYEKENLVKSVKRQKNDKKVIFPGTISYDQLIKYYNLADVFVMPSIKDELGNLDASPVAMMEAMSCGVPVVATKFSGNEDLVVDGITGYLVKEKNSKEIANAVVNLLSKTNGKKTTTKVRNIAKNHFSINLISKKYLDIFNQVLSSSRS